MYGKYVYFAIAAFLAELSVLSEFLPFFLLTVTYLYVLYKYKRFNNQHLLLLMAIVLIVFFAGHSAVINNKTKIPETETAFFLKYTQDPKIDGDLLQVQAFEQRYKEKILIRYYIQSEQEKKLLHSKSFYGFICKASGTLEKPKMAKNPNGFNYRNYLSAKEIFWIVKVQGSPLQNCAPVHQSATVIIKQLRFMGERYLEKHFPLEIASLSSALIFGDRSMLDSQLLGDYQQTGIVHLLAISGLHVSLLIGMVFFMGIRIGLTRPFMLNFLLIVIPIYVILTGASPSVIRAALMILLILITDKWKGSLKLLPIDAISLAFMLYIFFSPLVLFDIGFQLSFAVSFVIILSSSSILKGYLTNGAKMLVTSIISQLAALPFILYHYFGMSMIGIFANMLYIPLFSFVYLPGLYLLFFIQLIFHHTPPFLISLFLLIINFFNHLIGIMAGFSIISFVPGRPNLFLLIIYILILFRIFCIWESRPTFKRNVQLISITIVLFIFQPFWNFLNPFGEVTMIDVGQGDSILLHFPHNSGTYLIDTGGTMQFTEESWKEKGKPYEVGRDVVVPFLKGKGITKIDKLILTHGDMDHIGGAFSILKEIKVKQILMPSVRDPSNTEGAIVSLAKQKGIPVIKVSKGSHWNSGENEFYIVSPEKNFKGERNRGSISMIAQIGGVSWFFGGDLDQEGEKAIIKNYPHLKIDVLKAGHHGSRTSSAEAFIHQIKPSIALISAGEHNRFGHPHQEVLERLRAANITIYRTDIQGAITYRFYQRKGTFSTYMP
ncbi:DNA internalization-related competence protein ComEC/Rec2 [Paenibacillus sp. BSR1-1]|uniref:DNA internalization-related competence protein ComEC/Rec2 n=1 Tax=Paenibacillus sp. BSR1-1 TaxID=3020845 RepID=UPI0025B18FC7|nr:DNA internalization-related competence protein ComEC/Rec2 [Paenibacillus sp. BSR1-1]MDN3018599.1 DNA internalization-related competence protein ComEC/Rec2 [Paenibacillus sp. BSR1-1]